MKATVAILAAAMAASACSPKFDWRDYRGGNAPYAVLFPGKPATHTRTVNLDGRQVAMTMAATDIDGTTFAVGSAELPDAAQARLAIQAMKVAMVRNVGADAGSRIGSNVVTEKERDGGMDVEAHGAAGGRPLQLHGRFVARGKRVFQAVVIGPDNGVGAEQIDTFLRSLKVD